MSYITNIPFAPSTVISTRARWSENLLFPIQAAIYSIIESALLIRWSNS